MPKPETQNPTPDNWLEARVVFTPSETAAMADLIAMAFDDIGCGGVVSEDPNADVETDWARDRPAGPTEYAVIGYLPFDHKHEIRLAELKAKLARLEKTEAVSINLTTTEMAATDWSENWKEFFHPQKISEHLVVRPSWRDYDARPDDIIITIDPGMAFGTGTHPSTFMCMQLIETYLKKGDNFLDVGTGSGILMITAAKLGAKRLMGIDNDPEAVEIAQKNLLVNDIDPDLFDVYTGNLVKTVESCFDLICANILPKVIIPLTPDIPARLKPGGIFISSGIPDNDAADVIEKLNAIGFHILETRQKDSWVAMAARLK
jgi:ribosomal protein L11 methyltransferase